MRDFNSIERLEARRLLAVYGPDVTFGNGGSVGQDAHFVDPLANGKVLIAETQTTFDPDSGDSDGTRTTITRLNSNGSTDKSFGDAGQIAVDNIIGPLADSSRIYYVTEFGNVIQARSKTDFGLDKSFSSDGKTSVPYQIPSGATLDRLVVRSISPAPGGGLIVTADVEYIPNGQSDFVELRQLSKINANGSRDTTFGSGGFFALPETGTPHRVFPGGIYLVSGTTIQRYKLAGGQIDQSFGGTGSINVSYPPGLLGEASGGRLLHTTTRNGITRVYRRNADGSSDTAFAGGAGSVSLPRNSVERLTIDPQGRIVAVAARSLYRFSADGIAEGAPFNGSTSFAPGTLAFDSADRIYSGSTRLIRYDIVAPAALGTDRVLYITGDEAADTIVVYRAGGGRIGATVNGITTTFAPSSVLRVNVRAGNGDNNVNIAHTIGASVTAGSGNDTVVTSDANDSINDGGGSNTIALSGGADSLEIHPHQADHQEITGADGGKDIHFDGGSATIRLGSGIGTSISTTSVQVTDLDISLSGSSDVSVYGTTIKINITGDGNNHLHLNVATIADITLGDGDDEVFVDQNSTVRSGGGDDFVRILPDRRFPTGSTLIDGGDGNDTLEVGFESSSQANVTVNGGAGDDAIRGDKAAQEISGGDGNDRIDARGGNDVIRAGNGNDTINGQLGRDTIFGGAGDDQIDGGAHDDRLDGEAGNDTLWGSAGNDTLDGGVGIDSLYGGDGDDLLVSYDTFADRVFGEAGINKGDVDERDLLTDIQLLK